jgi:hypothetical protein
MGYSNSMGYTLAFLLVFIVGEIIVNKTWYPWLKKTIDPTIDEMEKTNVKWVGLPASVFKGVIERGVLAICLLSNIPTILVVFGTLKLGTRLSENKDMKNDYFLVGNLSTILLAVLYSILTAKIA